MTSYMSNSSFGGMQSGSFAPAYMPAQVDMSAMHPAMPVPQPQPHEDIVTSSAIDRTKLKTKICRNWQNGVPCPYGDRCAFAHGDSDKVTRATARANGQAPASMPMGVPIMRTTSSQSVTVTPSTQPLAQTASVFGAPQFSHFSKTPTDRPLTTSMPATPLTVQATGSPLSATKAPSTTYEQSTSPQDATQSKFLGTPQRNASEAPAHERAMELRSPGMDSLTDASFNSTHYRYDPYNTDSAQVPVVATPTTTALPLFPRAEEAPSPTASSCSKQTDVAVSAGTQSPTKRSPTGRDSVSSFDDAVIAHPVVSGRFLSPPTRSRRDENSPSEQMLSSSSDELSDDAAVGMKSRLRPRRASTPIHITSFDY